MIHAWNKMKTARRLGMIPPSNPERKRREEEEGAKEGPNYLSRCTDNMI
jgi:hypothetical protein